MKSLKNFKKLSRTELIKINGGSNNVAGECNNFIDTSITIAMPEPGRYCLSD
ncbi:bacteriocin-like protein [Aquimarina sp. LLG6339-5]|uniref:bacteriocin-like protein n=1 Tax=Aquimarina sp. LLG6339-5 TaxID=3160830 RepID=UPI003870537B